MSNTRTHCVPTSDEMQEAVVFALGNVSDLGRRFPGGSDSRSFRNSNSQVWSTGVWRTEVPGTDFSVGSSGKICLSFFPSDPWPQVTKLMSNSNVNRRPMIIQPPSRFKRYWRLTTLDGKCRKGVSASFWTENWRSKGSWHQNLAPTMTRRALSIYLHHLALGSLRILLEEFWWRQSPFPFERRNRRSRPP